MTQPTTPGQNIVGIVLTYERADNLISIMRQLIQDTQKRIDACYYIKLGLDVNEYIEKHTYNLKAFQDILKQTLDAYDSGHGAWHQQHDNVPEVDG